MKGSAVFTPVSAITRTARDDDGQAASDRIRPRPATILLPGFLGTTLPDWLDVRLRRGLAGVCLFAQNIDSPEQLRALTAHIHAANPLAIIAIDEEGGDVTRLHHRLGSPYPGNAILGRIDDEEYTRAVAVAVGWELRRAGCTLDFAPDIDINSHPDNPVIGVRSFGVEPELVARHSAAWVRGLASTGIGESAKHFPGHGDTALDSHLALPVVDRSLDELMERELVPFVAAIAAGVRTIMTSHILVPKLDPVYPATFSPAVLQGVLRNRLGFTGVIVSDALDMVAASGEIGIPEAAVRAIAAGCDLLCIGTDNSDGQLDEIETALSAAVSSGRLDPVRLADASERVGQLATEIARDLENIPIPEYTGEPLFSLDRTTATFDTVAFEAAGLIVNPHRLIVVLESQPNIAVGTPFRGPAAAGAPILVVREGEVLHLPADVQPVLVGSANHRLGWMRELIDDTRRTHPGTIVVDLGWPGDDRRYADIATFGTSRHVGLALLGWLQASADAISTELISAELISAELISADSDGADSKRANLNGADSHGAAWDRSPVKGVAT